MTRNPNRTTKPERRFVRRYNPYAARALGIGMAARWYRDGVLLDEARGFENILNDLKHGIVPLDLNDRVNAAINGQRDALERKLGLGPGMLTPNSSHVNHYSGGDAEPLGPSECGHYEVVDMAMNVDALAVPYLSEPRPQLTPDSWVTIEGAEGSAWFAKYQAYRAGLDLGPGYVAWDGEPWAESEKGAAEGAIYDVEADGTATLHDCTLAPCGWTQPRAGVPYEDEITDPNEGAAMHAEAIENALNDDINPEE
jgi:hypothetical protein